MPEGKPSALLSLSDRTKLDELAGALHGGGYALLATSGTAAALRQLGYACSEVEDVTQFPAILEGRVKTLHPKIFGGILAAPDNPKHTADLQRHGLPRIDAVAVTLYPFENVCARPEATSAEILENIDIGGVALLRAAAKNFARVSVLSHPGQYMDFAAALHEGGPGPGLRRRWAAEAFVRVARYDAAIAFYFSAAASDGLEDALDVHLPLAQRLRYGENPWAQAAFYHARGSDFLRQLAGKTLSYNNLLDVDSCLRLLAPIEQPDGFSAGAAPAAPVAAAIVKHTVPCGFAAADSSQAALVAALGADPISAFGGIVAVNAPVDEASAEVLRPRFLEVIAAPEFSAAALALLKAKKNLRIVTFERSLPGRLRTTLTLRSALGGVLAERPDPSAAPDEWRVMTSKQPSPQQWRDLLFGFGAVRQVKSNAAVVVKSQTVLGVCGGQTNRVAAVELACKRAGGAASGAVLATDGFFPFADGVEAAVAAGIAAVVAPSGSIRDDEIVAAAKRGDIALVFATRRYFLH